MDTDQLIVGLSVADGPSSECLREAVAEAASLAPAIIARMDAASGGGFPLPADARLIFAGIHVLAASRRHEALAPFLRFLRRAGPAADYTFGSGITETSADLTMSLFDGDVGPLVAATSPSRSLVTAI